ncbi:hypothetical protein RRG08_052889 [Elysia crispata]|uniref:Uncharacterized protein n=1 Tax=Elysia crispata TaxID=231223 RepID=A0AAE1DEM9_9GAST|nr:hypothetical protein RRG08_052889 [Elysia crispata]
MGDLPRSAVLCPCVVSPLSYPSVSTVTSPPTSVQFFPLFGSGVWRDVDTRSSSGVSSSVHCLSLTCGVVWTRDLHPVVSTVTSPPLVSSSVHCLSLACGVVWTRDLHPVVSTVTSPSPPTSVQFCPLFESDVWRGVDTRSSSCGQHGDLSPH